MALSDKWYLFVGGPWNNLLLNMGHGKHTEFRVPRLQETIQFDADDLQQTMYETYTLDHPLPTGVKVMSCLFRHSSMLGRVPVNP